MIYRQMQYFVSVVKNNSFTEAAEENFISQSAISQQIMALESELGIKLLIREKRKFILTEAGHYFYRQSLIVLDEVERVRRETIRIAKGNENEIRIGYLSSCRVDELTTALSLFSELHSDTHIQIEKGTHEELFKKLQADEIDIAINDQRRVFSDEYVNYQLIKAYCYVVFNKKNHLASLDELSPEDIKKVPCIIVSSKEQQDFEIEYYKSIYGFGDDYIVVESLEEARLLIAGNRGYFLMESSLQEFTPSDYFKRIPLCRYGRQLEKNYFAFWKKKNDSSNLRNFADLLRGQLCEE